MLPTAQYLVLRDRKAVVFATRLGAETTSGGDTGWMHCCTEGSWEGHPSGPFELTREDFLAFVAQFNARDSMVVDYDHRSLNASGSTEDVKAAGWVQDLEVRDNADTGKAELWALVEWTKPCAEMIRNDEVRYCSPVIVEDSIDGESGNAIGTELFNLAVTPNPFFKDNQAIQLNALGGTMSNPKPKLTAASAVDALQRVISKVDDSMSDYDVSDLVYQELGKEHDKEAVREVLAETGVVSGETAMEVANMDNPEDEITAAADEPGEDDVTEMADGPSDTAIAAITSLASKLEMSTDAAAAALTDAEDEVAELIRKKQSGEGNDADMAAADDPDKEKLAMRNEVLEGKVKRMSDELSELKADKAARDKAEAEGVVDKLIERKVVPASRRAGLVKLYVSNRKTFDEVVDVDAEGLHAKPPMGEQGQPTEVDPEKVAIGDLPPAVAYHFHGLMNTRQGRMGVEHCKKKAFELAARTAARQAG